MASQAKLYEVEGQHGTVYVYALHDSQTGMLWTERTEKAARSLAQEKQLTIIEQLTISRRELLRLMGQEPIEEPLAPPTRSGTLRHEPQAAPSANQAPAGGSWAGCKVVTGGQALPLTETPLSDDEIVVAPAPKSQKPIFSNKPAAEANETPPDEQDHIEGHTPGMLPRPKP